MSDLSIGEIKQFQRAISTAAWKLDLWKFAEVLGSNADHDWTKEKFKEFSELNRAINKFDVETLTRIINEGIRNQ